MLTALATISGFCAVPALLIAGMFRLVDGIWPFWFIMPWHRLSKNYRIARLLADSIRADHPQWNGASCSGLGATLAGEWSWEAKTNPDRATINGATLHFNPLERLLIRRALKDRSREIAAQAIHGALEKFVTDATR